MGEPQPAESAPTPASPTGGDRSTHFVFASKPFQVKGCHFAMAPDSGNPTFFVPLGAINGAVDLPSLRAEFGIQDESPDGKLLALIEKSLHYVKEIRPGDSIPREILDGTASWTVEDRHRLIAKSRLMVVVAAWISRTEAPISDLSALLKLAEDPETKQRVQEAFGEIATRLGMGPERKQEVVDRIDACAREITYIEALRDRFQAILRIAANITHLLSAYRNDRVFVEQLKRVQVLLRPPLADFKLIFDQVDAKVTDILGALKQFDRLVAAIRETRDDLHYGFMAWDKTIEEWQTQKLEPSPELEAVINHTYRFVAQKYPQNSAWKLKGQSTVRG
ncbi:MAG: hypothetical protein HY246_22215 [Proteobacteria bacterium]|nr:hypothetical protein [Pseudomonadota bacterium]